MTEKEEQLTRRVLERFRAQGRDETTTPDLAEEARMVVTLVGSVMRFSMRNWLSDDVPAATGELLRHTIDLIHRVAGNSQPTA
jgi:hypothetical protein